MPERMPCFAAGLYDRVARAAINTYYSRVADEITAKLDSGIILDIGTGPGYLPIEVVRRAPNIRVDGIDLCPKVIEIAQRNAKEAGLAAKIRFQVGNANKLRFENDSYDMVICTGVLHSWKNPARAINECYRVLRPGKEAWIYDPARIVPEDTGEAWRESIRGVDRITYRWLSLESSIITPKDYSTAEIEGMIVRTNFEDYDIEKQGDEVRVKLRK